MLSQLLQVLYGLLLGSLVGIEREKNNQSSGEYGFAGLRSFGLIGLLGSIAGYLNNIAFSVALLIGLLAMIIAVYVVSNIELNSKSSGITSEIAVIVVFLSGLLAGLGEYVLATSIIVCLVGVLGWKNYLHGIAKSITKQEFESILKFIIIAGIILPLLPNSNFGPLGVWNPYELWFLVVLISGISGLSYVAVKLIGYKKGLTISGFLGGLVSSTASTYSLAKMSKDMPKKTENSILAAMMLASVAMYFRVLFQVSIVNNDLFKFLVLPLGIGGLSLILFALYLGKNVSEKSTKKIDYDIENPINLINSIKFTALFGLVLVFVSYSKDIFGDQVLLVASTISGTVDTDAISLSLASLSRESLGLKIASVGIGLACISNMLSKSIYVWMAGTESLKRRYFQWILVNVGLVGGVLILLNIVNI